MRGKSTTILSLLIICILSIPLNFSQALNKSEILLDEEGTSFEFSVKVANYLTNGANSIQFSIRLISLQNNVPALDGLQIFFHLGNEENLHYLHSEIITAEFIELKEVNDTHDETVFFPYEKKWGRVEVDQSLVVHKKIPGSSLDIYDPH